MILWWEGRLCKEIWANTFQKFLFYFWGKFDLIISGPVFHNLFSCCLYSTDNSPISVVRSCDQSSLMLQRNAVKSSQEEYRNTVVKSCYQGSFMVQTLKHPDPSRHLSASDLFWDNWSNSHGSIKDLPAAGVGPSWPSVPPHRRVTLCFWTASCLWLSSCNSMAAASAISWLRPPRPVPVTLTIVSPPARMQTAEDVLMAFSLKLEKLGNITSVDRLKKVYPLLLRKISCHRYQSILESTWLTLCSYFFRSSTCFSCRPESVRSDSCLANSDGSVFPSKRQLINWPILKKDCKLGCLLGIYFMSCFWHWNINL